MVARSLELIGMVEEDWTTNVMVIYIESDKNNITDQRILQEISYVEKTSTHMFRTTKAMMSFTFYPFRRS